MSFAGSSIHSNSKRVHTSRHVSHVCWQDWANTRLTCLFILLHWEKKYFFCALVGLHSQQTIAKFLSLPQNTHYVLGQNQNQNQSLKISCEIDFVSHGDSWNWEVKGSLVAKSTLDGLLLPSYVDDYSIEGTSDLIVKDVSLDSAGTYTCRNSITPRVSRHAEVIVLGKLTQGGGRF